jgi:hypothetical protein
VWPAPPSPFERAALANFLGTTLIYVDNTSVPGDGSTNVVTFTNVAQDDLGLWNPAAPTTLIVPAGVGHVRAYSRINVNSPSANTGIYGEFAIRLQVNGLQPVPSLAVSDQIAPIGTNAGSHLFQLNVSSLLLPATPGDVWNCVVQQFTSGALNCGILAMGLECWT